TPGFGLEANLRFARFGATTLSVGGRAIIVVSDTLQSTQRVRERNKHFDAHLSLRRFLYRDRCSTLFADVHAGLGVVTIEDMNGNYARGVDLGFRFGAMFYGADNVSLGGVFGLSLGLLSTERYDEVDGFDDMWAYAGFLVGIGE